MVKSILNILFISKPFLRNYFNLDRAKYMISVYYELLIHIGYKTKIFFLYFFRSEFLLYSVKFYKGNQSR